MYGVQYFSDATATLGPATVQAARNDYERVQAYGGNLYFFSQRGLNQVGTGLAGAESMGLSALFIANAVAARSTIAQPTAAIASTTDDCE